MQTGFIVLFVSHAQLVVLLSFVTCLAVGVLEVPAHKGARLLKSVSEWM